MNKLNLKIKLVFLLGFCLFLFGFFYLGNKEVFAQTQLDELFKIRFTQCSGSGGVTPSSDVTNVPGEPTPTPDSDEIPKPSTEPEPVPVYSENLFIKADFEGLSDDSRDVAVTIRTGEDYSQTVVLSKEGESGPIPAIGLTIGQDYDFILSSWGFLSVRKSHKLLAGRNPASGFLDFGTLRTGDLNGDNQVNGLDWSLMKLNFGADGQK